MDLSSFDVNLFETSLKTNEIGRKLIYKNVTETTMDDAQKAALAGSPHGTAVLAESQSKARGTRNRKWVAHNTGNIYISYVCHRIPQVQDQREDFELVEVGASLAVFLALQELGIQDLKMKWLNDTWVRGHKMAGILVENKGLLPEHLADKPGTLLYILGIGININTDMRRNPELGTISTSARCELNGKITSREKFLATLCGYLEEVLSLERSELHTRVIPLYLFKPGMPVKMHRETDGKVIDVTIVEFHENWNASLQAATGEVMRMTTEFTSLRPCVQSTAFVYGGKLSPPWSSSAMLRTLGSLLNTTNTSVISLNDVKFMEGNWRNTCAILAVGELSLYAESSENIDKFLSMVRDYVASGGLAFLTGDAAAMLSSYLYSSPDVKQQLESKSKLHMEPQITSILPAGDSQSEPVIGYSVGPPIGMPVSELGESPENVSCYGNNDNTSNNAAIVVTKYGQGHCILASFNAEMTYADDVNLNTDDLKLLTDNVFRRDEIIQNLFRKFDL